MNASPGRRTFGFAEGGGTTRSDGAGGSTVTSKRWEAQRPGGSVAVTAMVVLPSAALTTVSVEPFTAAVATAGSEEVAV